MKDCHGVHIDCTCLREFKIPQIEFLFVKDQREKIGQHGKMQTGPPDKKEAERQEKLLGRKNRKDNSDGAVGGIKERNSDVATDDISENICEDFPIGE